MIKGYMANTDYDWYWVLLSQPPLDEVNFWQPSDIRTFKVVPPGAPFFFKLKKPHYAIAGFGYFMKKRRAEGDVAFFNSYRSSSKSFFLGPTPKSQKISSEQPHTAEK